MTSKQTFNSEIREHHMYLIFAVQMSLKELIELDNTKQLVNVFLIAFQMLFFYQEKRLRLTYKL